MKVNVVRIDDRLIHGQIVTKWIAEANATKIMVVDDKAAVDKTQQMLLKFAVPRGISLDILSKNDAIQALNEDNTDTGVLMLVRTPQDAVDLVKLGFTPSRLVVGNISNSKSKVGRTQLLDYIYVEPNDVEALQELDSLGITLETKAIPEERTKNILDLMAKKISK